MDQLLSAIQAYAAEQWASVPWWNWLLQLVSIGTSYYGAILNMRMRVSGYVVWTVGTVILAVLHVAGNLWLLLILDALFLHLNIKGFLLWARQKPEQIPLWLHRRLVRGE